MTSEAYLVWDGTTKYRNILAREILAKRSSLPPFEHFGGEQTTLNKRKGSTKLFSSKSMFFCSPRIPTLITRNRLGFFQLDCDLHAPRAAYLICGCLRHSRDASYAERLDAKLTTTSISENFSRAYTNIKGKPRRQAKN